MEVVEGRELEGERRLRLDSWSNQGSHGYRLRVCAKPLLESTQPTTRPIDCDQCCKSFSNYCNLYSEACISFEPSFKPFDGLDEPVSTIYAAGPKVLARNFSECHVRPNLLLPALHRLDYVRDKYTHMSHCFTNENQQVMGCWMDEPTEYLREQEPDLQSAAAGC
jgi:hypothetical protein